MRFRLVESDSKVRSDLKDLTGQKFGELTVIGYDKEKSRTRQDTYWKCLCSCGKECSVARKHLIDGSIKSCGHGKVQSGLDHYETNFKGMRDRQDRYNTNLEVIRNQKMQPNNTSGVKGVHYNKARGRWAASVSIGGKTIGRDFKDKEDAIKYRDELVNKYYKPKIAQAIKVGDLKESKESKESHYFMVRFKQWQDDDNYDYDDDEPLFTIIETQNEDLAEELFKSKFPEDTYFITSVEEIEADDIPKRIDRDYFLYKDFNETV